MSELVVIGFSDVAAAEKARDEIFGLDPEEGGSFSQFSEAVVATRDKKGRVKLSHLVHLWPLKTGAGSLWGLLVGAIFLHPVFGILAGAAAGLVVGGLADCGLDKEFIEALNDVLKPGTAALLLRHEISSPPEINQRIIEKLASIDGRVLRINLNTAMEHKLRQALARAERHAQGAMSAPPAEP